MKRSIQVGDLVKLRGMTKGEFPIGIVTKIFPNTWDEDKAFADIKWSNPKIAERWGIGSPISLRTIEKVK